MGKFILTMGCVSGDDVQVAIHRREDIFHWLKTLDHEGSSWTIVVHDEKLSHPPKDITEEIQGEYGTI